MAKNRPQTRLLPGHALVIASGEKTAFTPDQEALERLVDTVMTPASALLAGNEQAILEAVQSAASFEEAMQKVLELYPALSMDGLALELERAGFNADMFGRYAVNEETR